MPTQKKHERVLAAMRQDLTDWPQDRLFLTDAEAVSRYGASRITIRRAFATLQAEGLIQRIRHMGTKVCSNAVKSPRLVGFIGIEFASQGIESMIYRGIENCLRNVGASLVISNAENNPSLACQCVERLANLGVDGLIYTPMFMTPEENRQVAEAIIERHIPLIVALRYVPGMEKMLHHIVIDNYQGAYDVTRHLLSLGHLRVGFYHQIRLDVGPPHDSRHEGYRAALRDAGIKPDPALNFEMPMGSFPMMIQKIKTMKDPPTALFFNDDLALFAFLDVATRHGIRIPEDISVAGFDNLERIGVKQTSISAPYYELGQTAAVQLLNLMRNPTLEPQTTIMPVKLTIGETTGISPKVHPSKKVTV